MNQLVKHLGSTIYTTFEYLNIVSLYAIICVAMDSRIPLTLVPFQTNHIYIIYPAMNSNVVPD